MIEAPPSSPDRSLWLYKGKEYEFNPNVVIPKSVREGVRFVNEHAQNRNRPFNELFIKDIHSRALYYIPEFAGKYRQKGLDVRIGIIKKVRGGLFQEWLPVIQGGEELTKRMRVFGEWLEQETESLKGKPEDLLGALKVACQAHYLLISPEMHPFADGNGRVARLLSNGILMLNTHELMYYGVRILPVPLVRQTTGTGKITVENWVEDPYLKIVNNIHTQSSQDKKTNAFETFYANLWSGNIHEMIEEYKRRIRSGKISKADLALINKFEERAQRLNDFVLEQTINPKVEAHTLPKIF